MKRNIIVALAVVLGLAVAAGAQSIPAGTPVTVRISNELSSGKTATGQTFEGTVAKDVVVNGSTVAKAGTPVKGKVTYAKPSGRLHKPGILTMRLTSIGGTSVTSSSHSVQGKSHTKSNATKIGGGAAAGALIGGLAGGGKGAGIGALAGGAAGTGVAAYTGKQEAVVPAETAMTFTVGGGSGTTHRSTKRRH